VSLYAGAARERLIKLDTAVVSARPTRTTRPHITVSPRTAQGLPTQGIAFTLIQPTTDPAVGTGGDESAGESGGEMGGFTVTLFRSVPTVGTWAELAPFTALARYGEQYVLGDISGAWGLYFQVTGATEAGLILLGLAELD
jgi:hypothetical protein